MKSYDLLTLANRNLWRRKGRTFLTVLGVVIGTTAIVVMLSLGIGLVESQKKQMAQWGSLNIIRVEQAWTFPGDPNEGQQRKLTDEAILEIRQIEGVMAVSPAYDVGGEAKLGKKVGYFSLIGIDPSTMESLEFNVSHGRLLDGNDKFNVVAGAMVINNFWDPNQRHDHWKDPWQEGSQGDPLELLNKRVSFTLFNSRQQKRVYSLNVVGILSEGSMEHAWNVYGPLTEIKKMRDFVRQGMQDNPVFMYEKEIGIPQPPRGKPGVEEDQYSFALVRTKDVGFTRNISKDLRERGFNAYSIADNLEGIENAARQIQAILGGIGAITLLVAAIGITNTMVMSIYERTREIAIMKVVGASFADVRTLFLAESSLIGLMGGFFGIGFSFFLSFILNKYVGAFMGGGMGMDNATFQISMIPPWLVIFALLFSMVIGLISGLYPANRAIHLDPITAMRHG
jgi:putative ABC transport system permease protein